jgi:hypothetical protein
MGLAHKRSNKIYKRARVLAHKEEALTKSTKLGSGCIRGQPGTGNTYKIAPLPRPSIPLRLEQATRQHLITGRGHDTGGEEPTLIQYKGASRAIRESTLAGYRI